MRGLLLATALIVAAPATADAAAPWRLVDEPAPAAWQRMVAPAAAYWGVRPACEGGMDMRMMVNAEADGMASYGICSMLVSTGAVARIHGDYDRCVLVTHELGHILGHRHTEGGVMSSPLPERTDVPPCRTVARGDPPPSLAGLPVWTPPYAVSRTRPERPCTKDRDGNLHCGRITDLARFAERPMYGPQETDVITPMGTLFALAIAALIATTGVGLYASAKYLFTGKV